MLELLDDQRIVTASGVAFSPMQRELLRHIASGLTGEQIAARFGIPEYGVWNRLTALYRELGVGTASLAVVRGHECGLLVAVPCAVSGLGPQRRALLRAIARGDSDRVIAARRRIHVSSVRRRLTDMYRDLPARNRPHAIHLGFCAGILGGESNA